MARTTPTREDDLAVLRILDLHENLGLTAKAVGQRFGLSKNAVLGKVHRTSVVAAGIDCKCTRPENRDGGMPPRWWA